MVSTLEEAKERDMEIRREVRYFAVDKDGVAHWLTYDWTLEKLERDVLEKEQTNEE